MNARTFIRIWGWPIVLGLLAAAGLIGALVSDRLWASILALGGLGLPLVLILRYWPLRRLFDGTLRSSK